MNDEKLEQLLKSALAPDISQDEVAVPLKRKRYNSGLATVTSRAVAAVALIAIVGICTASYAVPGFAENIPIIGKIFATVENNVTYSGNYSKTGDVLSTDDAEYSKTDNGYTITVSEVYCDGYSFFLAVNISGEDVDFNKAPKHYTQSFPKDDSDEFLTSYIYIEANLIINNASYEKINVNNIIEGTVVDSKTFAGIIKSDLREKIADTESILLSVKGFGYDDPAIPSKPDDIGPTYWTKGCWDITFPYNIDPSTIKIVEVNEQAGSENINNVIITPIQVIVNFDLTDEFGDACYIACFNQDGEELQPDGIENGQARFAVQNKKIETLSMYVFNSFDDWKQMRNEGINSDASNKAVLIKELIVG